MDLGRIYVIDENRLTTDFIKAYTENKLTIHDGVAYWAEGSGKRGIMQHLPFKELPVQNMSEALQAAQSATILVGAASTMIILAAIAVQTKYLANKMDKIQKTVDLISQDVHTQNILFYMDKITDYSGTVEVARTLLKDKNLKNEIYDFAIPVLVSLAGKRNQMLSFTDNILLMSRRENISARHFELVMNFSQMVLDILPMNIHLEYLLCARISKLRMAEHILLDGADKYNLALHCYKRHLNELHRDLIRGSIKDKAIAYHAVENSAVQLFNCRENEILLSLPTGRAALLEAA
jgi:hypothetical protein